MLHLWVWQCGRFFAVWQWFYAVWQNFHKYYWIFLVTNVIGGRNAKHARISLFYKILVSIFTKSSIGYGRGLLETELPHICTHLYLQKYTQDFFKLFMYVLWTLMQVCVEYQKNFMSHFCFMLVKHKQISFLSRIFALFAYISKNTRRDFFNVFIYVLWTFMQICVEYQKIHIVFSFYALVNTKKYLF